jgi:hypothetical protein
MKILYGAFPESLIKTERGELKKSHKKGLYNKVKKAKK